MALRPVNPVNEKTTQDILTRLKRLEKAVFGSSAKVTSAKKDQLFRGPRGGVLYLISKGFLDKRRTATEVKDKLEDMDTITEGRLSKRRSIGSVSQMGHSPHL